MRIVKAMIIAFSMYSKIPMPQFAWKDEDIKYMLCFFPWIGAVIGGCIYLWVRLCEYFAIGPIAHTLIGVVIPLILTGGFHIPRTKLLAAKTAALAGEDLRWLPAYGPHTHPENWFEDRTGRDIILHELRKTVRLSGRDPLSPLIP